jgi:hypothetical protein
MATKQIKANMQEIARQSMLRGRIAKIDPDPVYVLRKQESIKTKLKNGDRMGTNFEILLLWGQFESPFFVDI